MRNIIAIFYFITYIQSGFGTDDIYIELLNFKNEETSFHIEVMITNNSTESYWFHYSALKSLVYLDGNILYYAPNFSFFMYSYNYQEDFYYQIMEILPNETIRKIFIYEGANYEIEVDLLRGIISRRERLSFSNIQYINMTFIFFNISISEILDLWEYYYRIYNNGVIITKLFRVTPLLMETR